MDKTFRLLVFTLSGQRFGLPLSRVERVVRIVEITPLPKAPEIVMGFINVRGLPVPVLNIRKLLGLPEAGITMNDQLIMARTARRPVALLVDHTEGVAGYGAEDVTTSEQLFPGIRYLEGVAKLKDGIIHVYDLDRFLSLEEEAVIDNFLNSAGHLPEADDYDA